MVNLINLKNYPWSWSRQFAIGLVSCAAIFISCASSQIPYHGFADQAALDAKDSYVIKESVGGSLDPMNLAKEDQRYQHGKIAYDRIEEGYYEWGRALYQMGYRDVYYVRDLAPHAFRHDNGGHL
jgi:hypothetical protein